MSELGSWMEAEISEQPTTVRRAVRRASRLELARPRGVVMYARGTSDHAATYGRYVIESVARIPVVLGAPSLTTGKPAVAAMSGWLAVGVSQSGQTNEIVDCLSFAAKQGAVALAITNDTDSPLARVADYVLDLDCGAERAVAATKSFTAECAALAALAYSWSERRCDWQPVFARIDSLVSEPLRGSIVDDLANADLAIVLGRAFHYALAGELALKIMEACGIWASAMSWADLMHGPIAAVPAGAATIVLSGASQVEQSHKAVKHRLASLGVNAHVVSAGHDHVACTGTAAPLTPLADAVLCQRIVLAAARLRGRDPDSPPGLTKVTQT